MRIALIQPKMKKRPMDTNLKICMAPSLALLTLAKLTPREHDLLFINENLERIHFDAEVDLAAITVTVDVMQRAAEIAAEYQKRGVPVVAGGIHITATADEAAEYFDAVCIGPAERVWESILTDSRAGRLKKRYQNMENFSGEELSAPDYFAIDQSKYLYTNVISASRGCPHRCDFCYNSCGGFRYVNRTMDSVLADIRTLSTRHIMFIDDNFIGNPVWTREFLHRIKPLRLKWNAAVSTKILDELELLDLMKETGCQSLFIGFESIQEGSLASVNKKQNEIKRYDRLIAEIHKRGIMINASMVFGLPEDDAGVFQSTLDWLIRNKIETVTAHIMTPYPGTVLHQRLLADNAILDFDLSHYNTAHVVYRPAKMSAQELCEGYLWIYREFYTMKNILKRMPAAKEQRIPFMLFNFLYRKYGRATEKLSKIIPLHRLGRWAAKLSYQVK